MIDCSSRLRFHHLVPLFFVFTIIFDPVAAVYRDKFKECQQNIQSVLNGTGSIGNITNTTVWDYDYLYRGPAKELDASFPRNEYLTVTYLGCLNLCSGGNNDAQLPEPVSVLSMVATWIFPLAIVLSLPYESLHRFKFRGTAVAVLNWLGSPQTALTATIFNFRQIREAYRRSKEQDRDPIWNDVYYVITCLNQFKIPDDDRTFFQTLVYGLCCPAIANRDDEDAELTRDLLSAMAHQLRMLRRRAVMPTLASLGTFLAAFIFSVVLSFAQVGENTKVDPLVLGLLYSWLPILVIFTIVDRNPVSSQRSAELISRWLYNVETLLRRRLHGTPIRWWEPNANRRERGRRQDGQQNGQLSNGLQPQNGPQQNAPQQQEPQLNPNRFRVGRFIGQGRQMQYCGFSWALIEEATPDKLVNSTDDKNERSYNACATRVMDRLNRNPPGGWYFTAFVALFLVWIEIGMAILLAYNTPTIGLGCWSGSFLMYGILSTASWFLQLFNSRVSLVRRVSTAFNLLAFCWLVIVTFFILTGATNTCWCNTLHLWGSVFGDYMNFENAMFYRENCHVVKYWAVAAGLGLTVPMCSLVVAIFWWTNCQPLWTANESNSNTELRSAIINWVWLT